MSTIHRCTSLDCNNLVPEEQLICGSCQARVEEFRRARKVPPTYPPVNPAEIDRTTPGQHNLKIDLAKELKPLREIELPFEPKDAERKPLIEQWDPEAIISLAQKYPKYYKSTQGMTEIDVYAVHYLFDIQDPSGAIQHASKKLLLSGVRTGGKSKFQDIKEARDTLNRWLELNKEK